MDTNPNKIAAELWDKLLRGQRTLKGDPLKIIQSAMEKAWQDGYAQRAIDNEAHGRAARATTSDPDFLDKKGNLRRAFESTPQQRQENEARASDAMSRLRSNKK